MPRWMLRLLNVEPQEGYKVLMLLLFNAFTGIPILFTATAGGALFLERSAASQMPWVYVATAVIVPLVGLLHVRLEDSFAARRILPAVLVLLTGASVGLQRLVTSVSDMWAAFALLAWTEVEFVMLSVVFWSAAETILTLRQGKRLFGLISSGQPAVAIVGGAATPFLAGALGTANLLWLSVGGVALSLVMLVVILHIWRAYFAEDKEENNGDEASSLREALRRPYLRVLFAFAALTTLTFYTVENAFFVVAEERFPDTDALAGFLGNVIAAIGVTALLLKTFVTGRLNARFGLRVALLIPATVAVLAGGTFAASALLGAPFAMLFWLGTGTRLLNESLEESVNQPAYYTLYQPLPRSIRAASRNVGETIVDQLSGGVAGLLLLLLMQGLGLGLSALTIMLVVIAISWLVVAVIAGRGYAHTLSEGLRRRGIAGADLPLDDPATLTSLRRSLESDRPAEVIYAIDLLRRSSVDRADAELAALLDHAYAEVRLHVTACFDETGHADLGERLLKRFAAEPIPVVRGRLLRAYAACQRGDFVGEVLPHIEDESETVQYGALIALLRWGGLQGAVYAGSRLLDLQKSGDPQHRRLAAQISGEVGVAEFHHVLLPLLEDPDVEVRRAAINSVASLQHPALLSAVVMAVGDDVLRSVAAAALIAVGEKAVPALAAAVRDETAAPYRRSQFLQILGRIGGSAVDVLLDRLRSGPSDECTAVLQALRACRFHAKTVYDRELLDRTVRDEVATAARVLAARVSIAGAPDADDLVAALDHEVHVSRERIFHALALSTDTEKIDKAWTSYLSDDRETQSMAVELLEQLVPYSQASLVVPLLDDIEIDERLRRLPDDLRAPIWPATEVLREIVCDRDVWSSPWITSCAIAPALATGALDEAALALVAEAAEHPWVIAVIGAALGGGAKDSIVDRVRLLRPSTVFGRLPDTVLALVADRAERLEVPVSEAIITKGEEGDALFVLAHGSLREHDGNHTLRNLGPGAIIGELSALVPERRSASVTTTAESVLFRLDRADLDRLLADRIEVAHAMIVVLVQRFLAAALTGSATSDHTGEQIDLSAAFGEVGEGTELSTLEKVIVLRTTPTFAHTPEEILTEVAQASVTRTLQAGKQLFAKGDSGRTMYVVIGGSLRVHDGDRTIAMLGPRTIVGEIAVLASEPRTASVTATEPTLLLELPRSTLYELIWNRVEVVRGILTVLVQRLRLMS